MQLYFQAKILSIKVSLVCEIPGKRDFFLQLVQLAFQLVPLLEQFPELPILFIERFIELRHFLASLARTQSREIILYEINVVDVDESPRIPNEFPLEFTELLHDLMVIAAACLHEGRHQLAEPPRVGIKIPAHLVFTRTVFPAFGKPFADIGRRFFRKIRLDDQRLLEIVLPDIVRLHDLVREILRIIVDVRMGRMSEDGLAPFDVPWAAADVPFL